jgi:hypothetical protein
LNILNFELRKAEAEVEFWRDFIGWWKDRHGEVTEPRIIEALDNAETRFARASGLVHGPNTAASISQIKN